MPAPYVCPLRRNVLATRVRAATAIILGATIVRKHCDGTTPKAVDITLNAKSLRRPPFSKVGLLFGMCSFPPAVKPLPMTTLPLPSPLPPLQLRHREPVDKES